MPTLHCYRRFVAMLLIVPFFGCQALHRAPDPRSDVVDRIPDSPQYSNLSTAECAYSQAIKLEEQCDALCVDYFFQSATLAWPDIERQVIECGKPSGRAAEIYRNSLRKLICNGQRFCRFHPARGLDIQTASGQITIPISYQGFTWRPDDFDRLLNISITSSKDLTTWYRCAGLGIATIALHNRRPSENFQRKQQWFPTTVVLRPVAGPDLANGFEFVFAEPSRVTALNINGSSVELERDLTAPIAYRLETREKNSVKEFIHPGSTTGNQGLFLLEPYQPGKIPILFVHGLLSDPYTWANLANEFYARPDLMARYQVMGFEYATGEPFLTSAALLREQLQELHSQLDPTGSDAALSQMVLVGHSMGGLVAKLQVTQSGTDLWDAVSCRPMEEIATTPETYEALAEAFYFEPSPRISRVVFMATPHRGSPWARRPVGRIGAKLVEEPSSLKAEHEQLLRDNPGVFSREFTRRIPTSIDLLRPDSDLLHTLDRLPINEQVQLHSVIGSGYRMLGAGNADGMVPVSSARHSSAVSEKFIHAKHTNVNKYPEAVEELFCILRRHLQENGPATNAVPLESVNFSD